MMDFVDNEISALPTRRYTILVTLDRVPSSMTAQIDLGYYSAVSDYNVTTACYRQLPRS